MKLFIFFLLFFIPGFSDEKTLSLFSKRISYHDTALFFEEDFRLDNSLGNLSAKKANLCNKTDLFIEDEINMFIKDQGTIKSDRANFNLSTKKAHFFSLNRPTIYKGLYSEHPLEIASQSIDIVFDQKLQDLKFNNDVNIVYDQKIFIHSDFLTYNPEENILNLTGNVSIKQGPTLTITSDSLIFYPQDQKWIIHGNVTCNLEDDVQFFYEGILKYDPKSKTLITLDSPLFFQNQDYCVKADHATFFLNESSLEKLVLEDTVQMSTKDSSCYAISQVLTYLPQERLFVLKSSENKNVLFWQKEKNISMSAKEIHMTFDPEKKSPQIKGVGGLRFSFNSEERNQLKQFFPKGYL